MNFRFFNAVAGISAIGTCGRPLREAAKEAEALACWRAEEEGCSTLDALNKNFKERVVSQVSFTVLSLATIFSVVWLATNTSASEWLLCLVALLPGGVLIGSSLFEQLLRKRWRI